MSGKIYLISKDGEPKYVGFTSQDIEARWARHCRDARGKSQCVLHRAIRKYGPKAFNVELVCEHPNERYALEILEPLYIDVYGTFASEGKGYNGTRGSDGVLGYKHSDDVKQKIGETKKGKPRSNETKRKISEAHKGKTKSIEHIAKCRATLQVQYDARVADEAARGTKRCPTCQSEKPFADFYRDARRRHGLACRCKDCSKR